MGRRPQVRINFNRDTAYLIRFEQAIEDDPDLTIAEKQKLIEAARPLRLALLEVDAARALRKS